MTRLFWPLCAAAALHAGVMDFQTLSQAKDAYEQGDYKAAAEHFGALQHKNEQALYDYGNALYREKKYDQAADAFRRIDDPALKPRALHNLGNSLANKGKTDEAIKAYEAALTLKEDEETRFNLDLLKQQKEQQKQDNKQDQQPNDQKNKQDQNQQQDQKRQNSENHSKEQQGQDQQQKGQDSSDAQEGKNASERSQNGQSSSTSRQERQNRAEGAEQSSESSEEETKPQQAQGKTEMAQPISDMEERKYNKMLDKRGIKTLMIPLPSKGEPRNDETTPW